MSSLRSVITIIQFPAPRVWSISILSHCQGCLLVGTEFLSPYPSHNHRKSCGYPHRIPIPTETQTPTYLYLHPNLGLWANTTLSIKPEVGRWTSASFCRDNFHYKRRILIFCLSHWQLATTWCMFYAKVSSTDQRIDWSSLNAFWVEFWFWTQYSNCKKYWH